jgi:hypothetical protein
MFSDEVFFALRSHNEVKVGDCLLDESYINTI